MQPGEKPQLTAIICEDEALTSAALAGDCEKLGYQVLAKPCNGIEAIEAALNHAPDLVLMDIKMPEMDGIEAAREILKQLDTTLIVITGYVTEAFIDGAAEAGVAGYLLKPVSLDQLHCAVRVATERAGRLQEAVEAADAARAALENRKRVERAKGLLMEFRGLSERDAYRLLQKRSQDERRPMADLAEEVIGTYAPSPEGGANEAPAGQAPGSP